MWLLPDDDNFSLDCKHSLQVAGHGVDSSGTSQGAGRGGEAGALQAVATPKPAERPSKQGGMDTVADRMRSAFKQLRAWGTDADADADADAESPFVAEVCTNVLLLFDQYLTATVVCKRRVNV